jgi:hypothetical protein
MGYSVEGDGGYNLLQATQVWKICAFSLSKTNYPVNRALAMYPKCTEESHTTSILAGVFSSADDAYGFCMGA